MKGGRNGQLLNPSERKLEGSKARKMTVERLEQPAMGGGRHPKVGQQKKGNNKGGRREFQEEYIPSGKPNLGKLRRKGTGESYKMMAKSSIVRALMGGLRT